MLVRNLRVAFETIMRADGAMTRAATLVENGNDPVYFVSATAVELWRGGR